MTTKLMKAMKPEDTMKILTKTLKDYRSMWVLILGVALLSACPLPPDKDGKPPGDPCQGNTDCADDVCHRGICAAPSPKSEGDACKGDYECASWRCEGSVCKPGNEPAGTPCRSGAECATRRCECSTNACSFKVCGEGKPPADAGVDALPSDAPMPAPDALVPDAPAPAPDTLAPDTLAPDTSVPDTLAPDVSGGCKNNADCNDNNECTWDECNLTTHVCKNTVQIDKGCNDNDLCTTGDKCNAAGVCEGKDYTVGNPQCQALPCETVTCDGLGGCQKTLKPDTCRIGTTTPVCYAPGDKNPTDACQACVPSEDPLGWSFTRASGCLKTLVKRTFNYFNDGPLGSGQLANPVALAMDDTAKKLYVLDVGSYGGKIRVFDLKTGYLSTIVGPKGQTSPTSGAQNGTGLQAQFKSPRGIAIDVSDAKHKKLYVADTGNCLLRRVDLSKAETDPAFVTTVAGVAGECTSTDGGVALARLTTNFINVAVDSTGKVLLNEGNLRRYDPTLQRITTLYTGMPHGWAMALLDDDNILARSHMKYGVWSIQPSITSAIRIAGIDFDMNNWTCVDVDGPALTKAKFTMIGGIAVLGSGASARVFVSDAYTWRGNTLREIGPEDPTTHVRQVTTLAGKCNTTGSSDGGLSARLRTPGALAVGSTTITTKAGPITYHTVYLLDDNGLRSYRLK